MPGRGPLHYLRDVRMLSDALDRESFDLVHCHSSHDHYVAAAARRGHFEALWAMRVVASANVRRPPDGAANVASAVIR